MVTDKDMTTMKNLAMPINSVQNLAMPLYAVRNLAMPFYTTVQDLTMPLFTAQGLTKSKRNKGEGGEQPKSCHVRPLASIPARRS